jgi:hypothetical protein
MFASVAVLAVAGVNARAELPIIAKARAWYGPEAALNAVQSIHYVGVLTQPAPNDAPVPIDMLFAKPFRQRIVAKAAKGTETTVLDAYDAWQKMQDPKDATKWTVTLLSIDGLKRLRANTWENLYYFRGLEKEGGQVADKGDAIADGVACRKVAFIHSPDIIFYRYFERATGRLVLTETEAGGSFRTEGEIVVNGIRFPKKLITTSPSTKGGMQTATLTFDRVTVNEPVPDELFTLPSFTSR